MSNLDSCARTRDIEFNTALCSKKTSMRLSRLWPLLVLFPIACLADSAGLAAFGRINAEKFKSETIGSSGVSVGAATTVQGSFDRLDVAALNLSYDDVAGEAIVESNFAHLQSMRVSETCKGTGSFAAQKSFGAKAVVRRRTCERFVVMDGDVRAANIAGARIKMNPTQFREISKQGVKAEMDFTIGHANTNQTVRFSDLVDDATISDPSETRMKVWIVYGRVDEVRWLLPNEKQSVAVWHRP